MLFSTQWGKLIESLSTPAALKLFKDLDIGINRVYSGERKIKDNGIDKIELDIVLCNTTVAIVVEVKTTFRRSDVSEFFKKMKTVKKYFPEFADKQLYAATAAIKYNDSSDVIAQKKACSLSTPPAMACSASPNRRKGRCFNQCPTQMSIFAE